MGFDDAFEKAKALQRGDVIFNASTGKWEARNSQKPLTMKQRIFGHWGNPSDPPSTQQPPPQNQSSVGLTPYQLQCIEQMNDLARRGTITDAVRDDEIHRIMAETHR